MKNLCKFCETVMEEGMKFCPECGAKYLYTDDNYYFSVSSPVAFCKKELLISERGTPFLSLMLKSVTARPIIACYVGCKCYGIAGEELDELKDYVYLDLDLNENDVFGDDVLIELPNKTTRDIKPYISKVVFEDREVFNVGVDEIFEIGEKQEQPDSYENALTEALESYIASSFCDNESYEIIERLSPEHPALYIPVALNPSGEIKTILQNWVTLNLRECQSGGLGYDYNNIANSYETVVDSLSDILENSIFPKEDIYNFDTSFFETKVLDGEYKSLFALAFHFCIFESIFQVYEESLEHTLCDTRNMKSSFFSDYPTNFADQNLEYALVPIAAGLASSMFLLASTVYSCAPLTNQHKNEIKNTLNNCLDFIQTLEDKLEIRKAKITSKTWLKMSTKVLEGQPSMLHPNTLRYTTISNAKNFFLEKLNGTV